MTGPRQDNAKTENAAVSDPTRATTAQREQAIREAAEQAVLRHQWRSAWMRCACGWHGTKSGMPWHIAAMVVDEIWLAQQENTVRSENVT